VVELYCGTALGTPFVLSLGDKLQQQVAATYHSVCAGRATTICSCSDTSQRQIASSLLENFCEILSPQRVAQILSDLIFCNMLLRQNSVDKTKVFSEILQYT